MSGRETAALLSRRNTGLLLDGTTGHLSERESFQNVCVIARVGAGKTTRYIIPNVLARAKTKSSLVINDPKGEVFTATAGYMQAHGYRVITINPEAVETSSRFNPLLEAKSDIELEQVAEVLVRAGSGNSSKDQFWDNGAVRLVAVLLKLLRRSAHEDPAFFTL